MGGTKSPSALTFSHVSVKAVKGTPGAWTGPSSLVPKDLRMSVGKQSSLRQQVMGKCREQVAIVQMLLADPVLAYGCLAD